MNNNLRSLRLEYGLSQADLGRMVGRSQQSIAKYENGETDPNLETIIMLAEALNVSIDYLLCRTSVKNLIIELKPNSLVNGEDRLLSYYRGLSSQNKEVVSSIAKQLKKSNK